MTNDEAKLLVPGLYRLHFKPMLRLGGLVALAAVGGLASGARWYACSSWRSDDGEPELLTSSNWSVVERVERLVEDPSVKGTFAFEEVEKDAAGLFRVGDIVDVLGFATISVCGAPAFVPPFRIEAFEPEGFVHVRDANGRRSSVHYRKLLLLGKAESETIPVGSLKEAALAEALSEILGAVTSGALVPDARIKELAALLPARLRPDPLRELLDRKFMECATCMVKPPALSLCMGCLSNRVLISKLRSALRQSIREE